MALRIIQPSEPMLVETTITTIYKEPGVGGTSLGYTAENPLLLNFDKAAYRAKRTAPTTTPRDWPEVAEINAAFLAPFQTIVVDTVGRALDMLTADIAKRGPKMTQGAGSLSLQGWGVLKGEFVNWMNFLRSLGKDIVLIAHATEEKKGDDVIIRLDVQGGSKNEIYKVTDSMGRLTIVNGKRTLQFSPTDVAYGKNPAQIDPVELPHHLSPEWSGFLGRVIGDIKAKINALSEEQQAVTLALTEWAGEIRKATSAEAMTRLIAAANLLPGGVQKAAKAALAKAAKDVGFTYDKAAGKYVEVAP